LTEHTSVMLSLCLQSLQPRSRDRRTQVIKRCSCSVLNIR